MNLGKLSTVLIISVVAVAVVAGCIGQTTPKPPLYNITKDGVFYEFNNNIYDSLNVTISNKTAIYAKLVTPNQMWLLFTDDPADNSAVAIAASNIASKVQNYNTYSLGKMVLINGYDMANTTGQNNLTLDQLHGTLIEVRGSSLANNTSVYLSGNRIIVQGTNYTQLSMAADRLTLVLFEDELRALNVTIPE